MNSRWVCPHCHQLIALVSIADDAIECPICSWVYLKSFWGAMNVPDGCLVLISGKWQQRNGANWIMREEREVAL